jgi:hypothetical protein
MSRFWDFIRLKGNRERLAWLGGGAVVVVTGLWTAFVYLFPLKTEPAIGETKLTASCGSVAIGGNVTDATITAGNPTRTDCKGLK